MKTTDDWEALLDGISPTPWEFEGLDDLRGNDGEPLIGGDSTGGGYVMGDANGEIIAAAPEVVAEVVRLRRELEDLIRKVGTEDHYPPADDWERGVDAAYRDVTDTLTRILEGHTDG